MTKNVRPPTSTHSDTIAPDLDMMTDPASIPAAAVSYPHFETNIRYSDLSSLNTYQICLPRPLPQYSSTSTPPPPSSSPPQIWLIYIHGGAWYDTQQSATTFDRTQSLLLQDHPTLLAHIAGFASLNYRLSPRPSSPSTASSPPDPAHSARHPDHINDIRTALAHLQARYPSARRYILAGHSCGATLAFQVAMRTSSSIWSSTQRQVIPSPLAILGIEGIYDLPALVRYHLRIGEPFYRAFVQGAFGTDEETWRRVSPVAAEWEAEDESEGREGSTVPHAVVLAHSRADELVEWEQVELMREALVRMGFEEGGLEHSRRTE